MRSPTWRGFSADGRKVLFRLSDGAGQAICLVVVEAAIDALSLAIMEGLRPGTLYAARERLAARLAGLSAAAGGACERLRLWGGHKDWSDCLRMRAAEED